MCLSTLIKAISMAAVLTAMSGAWAGGDSQLERGRYLVSIGTCNDCHTPGFGESGGQMPEKDWLTGSGLGFQGPWGTTYPTNLRLSVRAMSESNWITHARTAMRPPMPWFALRDMTDADLRAIYRYIVSLGPKGEPAPAYVPPGQAVAAPYFQLVLPPPNAAARTR